MTHYFSCSRSRSDGSRRALRRPAILTVALALALAPVAGGAGDAGPACGGAECGGAERGWVAGSVEVWQAAVRATGPKNDLDVVLYLEPAGTVDLAPATARATMDQQGLVFVPHVLAVQKGTTVTFLNSDPDEHNVYFLNDRTGDTLDIGTWGSGVSVDHRFEEAGPVITLCKLHLEMGAYVVVVDGPWFTTAKLDPATSAARFEIGGVPPGEYRLIAWHKKLRQKGGAVPITVTGGGTSAVAVVITKAKYARTK